jgi:photosystem II stability/assembly factor-like uncharacterized protein
MKKTTLYLKNIFMLSGLATAVLIIFAIKTYAQQQVISLGNDGATILTLQSGEKIVSRIPSSSPETIITNGTNIAQDPVSGIRDFTWLLKFSAPGKVFKDVSFANSQVGYIVTELGTVYKSIDGGDSWTSVMNLGFPYYWYGVHALSADTVVISGFNNQASIFQGVVRWTFDGGNTWSSDINLEVPVTGVGWLERIHFFNPDTGIVFNSFSGGCWYTTNGGKNSTSWTYMIINSDLGWIAGNIDAQSSGNVYATGIHFANSSDFGASWISGPSIDSIFDGGVDFLDSDNLYGWTGGGQISSPVSGWVHRTLDGGQSWSSRLNTFPYPIRALRFFNETTGLAVGGNLYDEAGAIYSTTDGGLTWNTDINTSAEMFSIESKQVSVDSTDIWCVGSTGGGTGFTGVLYKTRMGKLATAIHNNSPAISSRFGLYQNYPNPFSLMTTITFTLPVTSYTTLKIYGVLGNEIATLVNGIEKSGYTSVEFDGSRLSGGVYYYVLRSGDYNETKKLLLTK